MALIRPGLLHLLIGFGLGAQVPSPAAAPAARYDRHVHRLKRSLPPGFTMLVEAPFVIIGDGPEEELRRTATHTVRWAIDHLKRRYFQKDPARILDIWLFRGQASYQRNTRRIFGEDPISLYGYYAPEKGALIMNIQTGAGTLVHEIVHPFMEANFPHCPPWFNEGLGSLYEACSEREGVIVGTLNWRLKGLQQAIRKGPLPTFEVLMGLDDDGFYQRDSGRNYAQARYLCYYLQEKGLLQEYYRAFCHDAKVDPSGVRTLKRLLKEDDLEAFQKHWQGYVLGLKLP